MHLDELLALKLMLSKIYCFDYEHRLANFVELTRATFVAMANYVFTSSNVFTSPPPTNQHSQPRLIGTEQPNQTTSMSFHCQH